MISKGFQRSSALSQNNSLKINISNLYLDSTTWPRCEKRELSHKKHATSALCVRFRSRSLFGRGNYVFVKNHAIGHTSNTSKNTVMNTHGPRLNELIYLVLKHPTRVYDYTTGHVIDPTKAQTYATWYALVAVHRVANFIMHTSYYMNVKKIIQFISISNCICTHFGICVDWDLF